MNRARTVVATAVLAACGAWPLATLAQSSTSPATSGGAQPSDSARATTGNQPAGQTMSPATGSSTEAGGSSSGMTGASSTYGATGPTSSSSYGTTGRDATTGLSDAEWEAGRSSRYSLLPWTSYGYVGLNLGRSNWSDSCEGFSGIFNCDNTAFSGKVYTGGLISRMVGFELGYVNFGRPDTSYGSWKAHGINASIVANLPVDPVNIFARFGTTYGWTRTPAGAGLNSGDDNGFGLAYGAGIGFDVTPQFMVTAEWDRNRFRFVNGDQDLDMYSIGVRYKF